MSKFRWNGLMACLIKILISSSTKLDGVYTEMQIISYNFIILKHIQINLQFRNILLLTVRLSFLGQSVL